MSTAPITSGLAIWFTGLSGAGKTTISRVVAAELKRLGLPVCLLDAGDLRQNLFPELGFTQADREENVRRLGYLAQLISQNGVITMVAAMSPERAGRDAVRRQIPTFLEVFVDAPVELCEQRDPMGLYKRFRQHEVSHISGLDEPYEAPLQPEVHCLTGEHTVEECAAQVVAALLAAVQR